MNSTIATNKKRTKRSIKQTYTRETEEYVHCNTAIRETMPSPLAC
jgi:hypothetical protein